jgi:hypothetical protein
MIKFTTELKRFGKQGEKTGWTYIDIPQEIADQLKPGCKTSYRVKGKIDKMTVKAVALVPMGGGDFIIAVNADMRKELRKEKGTMVSVQLKVDDEVFQTPTYIAECIADDPEAQACYGKLPLSHRRYWVNWIEDAKTDATRAKRIARMLDALARGSGFSEMIRAEKAKKERDGFYRTYRTNTGNG